MANTTERGGISIELEHIFPIIKKWLYSEKEIFLREIVSNACDAITKLRRLSSLGEAEIDLSDSKINVTLDEELSTITVCDNGIGMNEEELRKYICQIALSGAMDFIKKYEGEEAEGQKNGIIGHFGLGFYSVFMVCDTVDVLTRSYTGSPLVKWTCNDVGEYEMDAEYSDEAGLVPTHGTAIIIHVNDEGKEFLRAARLREILEKYCAFMPEKIFFAEGDKEAEQINDTTPLWLKNPSDCTEEEYKDFYKKVFSDWKEPLFHIHIKADYPLNFKGILYFPRIGSEFESLEGQVKLYYNQVFVADNIKEVIPDYLLMLKGVLDCPELPLNVSRSYLQNSGYVTKISAHIVKKVADKLTSMFNLDRPAFEEIWRDIKTFVEYGSMRDKKFYDRVKDILLLETTDGEFKTVSEYLEGARESHENKIYYATDKTAQSRYVAMLKDQGVEVVLLPTVIDTQFVNVIEENNEGVKFCRVDSEVADVLKADGEITELPAVAELFRKVALEGTKVEFQRLRDEKTPAVLNISEEMRRMADMMRMYKMGSEFPIEQTIVVNTASNLINKLDEKLSAGENDTAELMARQIYMLSSLAQRQLTADELTGFLDESYDILLRI